MTTLTWNRIRPGRWLLKSADGRIWAAVTPYRSLHACKGQHRATIMGPTPYWRGKRHWTTGIGVAAAKRNAIKSIECQTFEPFRVVS